MRKLSLIFQLLIVLSIILLFVLFFRQQKLISENLKNSLNNKPYLAAKNSDSRSLSIAYINSDSILTGYNYYQELKKQLELQQQNAERQLELKSKDLEELGESLKTMVGKGIISEDEAQLKFYNKQSEVEKYKSSLSESLMLSEKKLTEQLYDTIVNYLKRFNSQTKFSYILSYSKGGGIIIAPETLDLTKDVLKGLNEEFRKGK